MSYVQLLLPFIAVISIIAAGVILLNQQFRKSLYKRKLAEEQLKNRHNQEILSTSIRVQENERKRIAQDLHDELGAALSISRMHLLRLEKLGQSDKDTALGELPKVREYVETALSTSRRISHELMPGQLQTMGLEKALEGIADRAHIANGLEVQLAIHCNASALPWEVSLALYRIFSELLNNTLKHAEATRVSFELHTQADGLQLHYRDNGKGLPEGGNPMAGIGLQSIEGRLKALGGSFAAATHPQGGFTAEGHVPLTTT